MFLWLFVWVIKWVIVLIPIYLIATDKKINGKCAEKWALIIFVLSLVFGWFIEYMVIRKEAGSAFEPSIYYVFVVLGAWIVSAWGMYLYFIYSVRDTERCRKVDGV